ncbi:PEP-CTERM sorting domain-containing protein [Nostocaceae cyanobacterium CENA357]|uniref:PEP-CTERM sorting domain-containing protein n=1 Tax=Atlanticothrix silvestris CENA357 TaxID=1725252 RepID=A0A8J7HFD3_9CYAN|nr:all3515 family Zur-repressed PEP-CTERM protein [Atlanticothrix silvestris]MBH8551481.1 PEP-CTERM sorting domain-containing protein [Atlanticothrix silvestris CENA357]
MVSKNTTCSRKQTTSLAISFIVAVPLALSSAVAPAQAHSDDHNHGHTEYFIGLDGLDILNRGIYTGLENPNYNRLTLLFAHQEEDPTTNHFHGIGTYSYSGSVDNPSIAATNTNNRIPEPYTGLPSLKLSPGTGIYTGRLISSPTNEEYSNLNIQAVTSLKNSSELEDQYLFNSSNNRWQQSLEGANIGLQLLSISNGLNIADSDGVNILNSVGEIYTIGSGDDFSFIPTFWTNATAPLGNYSATFKLVDLATDNNRTPFGESGTFSFDFEVAKVPEPSNTVALSLVSLLGVSLSRLKKRYVKG